jgi:branched-chain amino acid transport system permease protein
MAGFMALGAYGYAISILSFGLPWWLGIIIGCIAATIFAVILGIPTLRLRADYLAIVTIAAAEIVRLLLTTQLFDAFTNSADGLGGYHAGFRGANPFPAEAADGTKIIYGFGPWQWTADQLWVRVFGIILLAIAVYLVWALMRSPWGRVLKGIREDEDAVRSLGKNVYAYKMQSLMIGGLIGGLAGIMSALQHSAINPSFFATDTTFFAYTVLLLGGAARVLGPVAGTIIFWFLISFLDLFFSQATSGVDPLIPASIMNSNQASLMRFIIMGLSLMLLMIFRPQGIFGDRRELALDAR